MKLSTIFLSLALAMSVSFGAQKRSVSVSQTSLTQTNAYTALKWDFGSTGRNFADGDTLTFVSDSVLNSFVRARDVGPMARNQQAVNYFLPDSLYFCVEAARVDADTGSSVLSFSGSVNGGTFVTWPGVATNDLGLTQTRSLGCYGRRFVPSLTVKPVMVFGGSTDTAKIYSVILFTK